MNGILFFCHGSRDAQWRVPFEQIHTEFRGMHASKLSELAFLEFMTPDFAAGVKSLVDRDATSIRVIPLFLAQGAHTRRDLGDLLEKAQLDHPSIRFTVAPAIGEVDSIRAAIASWVAGQI